MKLIYLKVKKKIYLLLLFYIIKLEFTTYFKNAKYH